MTLHPINGLSLNNLKLGYSYFFPTNNLQVTSLQLETGKTNTTKLSQTNTKCKIYQILVQKAIPNVQQCITDLFAGQFHQMSV